MAPYQRIPHSLGRTWICHAEVFMCLNMFFSGSGQLKPLFNSDITAEDSVSLGAEFLGVHITLQGGYVES